MRQVSCMFSIHKSTDLTGTTLTTVYTVPAKTVSIVREIFIANYDSSARNLNLQINLF